MDKIRELVKRGTPVYIIPYKEPKVWGVGGIGEYWYGAEAGDKSSIARVKTESARMEDLLTGAPDDILGAGVVARFGKTLPLVKILTPEKRLSIQFHDKKNELWIVTGINSAIAGDSPEIIIGFSPRLIKKLGGDIRDKYREALEKFGLALNEAIVGLEKMGKEDLLSARGDVMAAAKECGGEDRKINEIFRRLSDLKRDLDGFYNHVRVDVGDVIPVSAGTLHALGAGIEVVEPQIPGPTQSLEDGTAYPVRYYFPGYPRRGASRELDIARVNELKTGVWERSLPHITRENDGIKVERLPGGFEEKGMEVDRITMEGGKKLEYAGIKSFHTLVTVGGSAEVRVGRTNYKLPGAFAGGEMLLIPASVGGFTVFASEESRIIDTYTPL